MSSPEVWQDVRDRITAWAAAYGVPLALPNEQAEGIPEPWDGLGTDEVAAPRNWIAVEIYGDVAEAMELGQGYWEESGNAVFHVMSPLNSGMTAGLNLRKEVCNLFRLAPSGAVVYRGVVLDPGAATEDGKWHRLTARIGYTYTDHPTGE